MFAFPIRTDRRQQRTPWVNRALIAANVVVFLATQQMVRQHDSTIARFYLDPQQAHLYQFLSYQFLHADLTHLLGNMLFLYVFGNGVEDRLGKVAYLAFYLAGGVLAGWGHMMAQSVPVLGASGAVAAVSGAYLALFPLTNVTIFYWFWFIGTFEVSSLAVIGFYIALNVVSHLMGLGQVAYLAHLAGYAYGLLVGMALLWSHLLLREPYDLLSLIEQRRRRAQFAAMAQRGYRPWHADAARATPRATVSSSPVNAEPTRGQANQRILELRSQIGQALAEQRLAGAAALYRELLDLSPHAVMAQQSQLDIANQLMSEGRHQAAATAYELFLNTYTTYAQREQVELILGLVCARYLKRGQRARELLTAALPRLDDPGQRSLAQQTLDGITSS